MRVGTLVDQMVAAQIGYCTARSSLVSAIEANELRIEDDFLMIDGSSLSWVSPRKPATKKIFARAFDRLVGDGSGCWLDRSILDGVREDTQSHRVRIGRDDRTKLAEYLYSSLDPSLMDHIGVMLERFGNVNTRLAEL